MSISSNVNELMNGDGLLFSSINDLGILKKIFFTALFLLVFYVFMPWHINSDTKAHYDFIARLSTPIVLSYAASILMLIWWLVFHELSKNRLMMYLPAIACSIVFAVDCVSIFASATNSSIVFGPKDGGDHLFFYFSLQPIIFAVRLLLIYWIIKYFRPALQKNPNGVYILFFPVAVPVFVWSMIFVFFTGYDYDMMLISFAVMPVIGLFAWICAKFPPLLAATLHITMALFMCVFVLASLITMMVGGMRRD